MFFFWFLLWSEEYTHDLHLDGFCLFGIASAAFIKGRHLLTAPMEVDMRLVGRLGLCFAKNKWLLF